MKTFTKLALFVAVFGLIAMADPMTMDYDHAANFANYKTFKIVALKSNATLDQLQIQRFNNDVAAAFVAKGLTQTQSDKADVYIGWQLNTQAQQQFNSYNMGGIGWGGWGGGMSTTTTSTIMTGVFAIDMYDVVKKQLVWRGTISSSDISGSPQKQAENAQKNITKIVQNYYPPNEEKKKKKFF